MSNPMTDLKRELLAAAERQHLAAPAPVRERRFRWYARAPRLLSIAAAVTVAAAAALFITTPWSNSPGFLARAEAALTPPTNMILHAKLTETVCSKPKRRWTAQFWADEHTGRYRGLFRDTLLPYPFRTFTLNELLHGRCILRPSRYEAGLVLGPRNVLYWSPQLKKWVPSTVLLRFLPQNTLYRYPPKAGKDLTLFGRVPALDPLAAVRNSIRNGRAHDQGKTTLNGRTVERIRLDPCPPGKCMNEAGGYAYVDPETYYPVEMGIDGRTIHFSKYEYLPRTPANLALTDIRTQHPHARLTTRG